MTTATINRWLAPCRRMTLHIYGQMLLADENRDLGVECCVLYCNPVLYAVGGEKSLEKDGLPNGARGGMG